MSDSNQGCDKVYAVHTTYSRRNHSATSIANTLVLVFAQTKAEAIEHARSTVEEDGELGTRYTYDGAIVLEVEDPRIPALTAERDMLRAALEEAHRFIAKEYSCPKSQALEGEFVSAEARPVWNNICVALGEIDEQD
jgi:hypothetical protein